jgi:hypothetical protein
VMMGDLDQELSSLAAATNVTRHELYPGFDLPTRRLDLLSKMKAMNSLFLFHYSSCCWLGLQYEVLLLKR